MPALSCRVTITEPPVAVGAPVDQLHMSTPVDVCWNDRKVPGPHERNRLPPSDADTARAGASNTAALEALIAASTACRERVKSGLDCAK